MDFCRARAATGRNRCIIWQRCHAELSTEAHWESRYSVAEPSPSLKAKKSRRDNVEIKSGRHLWDLRNSQMDKEAGIISPESSPSHHFIQFTGDAFPDNLIAFALHSLCCVFLHIYLCVCVCVWPAWLELPGDKVLICPLLSSYPLKKYWHVGDIY